MADFLLHRWQLLALLGVAIVSIVWIVVMARRSERNAQTRHPDEPEWNRNGEEDRGPWGN